MFLNSSLFVLRGLLVNNNHRLIRPAIPSAAEHFVNHLVAVNQLLGVTNRVAMTNRKEHSPDDESNTRLYAFFQHFLQDDPKP